MSETPWYMKHLNFFMNTETGMVRAFLTNPCYGKWVPTRQRYPSPPIGRKRMAEFFARPRPTGGQG